MTTFREDFYAAGWVHVTDKKDIVMGALTFGAQACCRRGAVRVHLVWGDMYEHDGSVYLADAGASRPMTIAAIVVDANVRKNGAAREALRNLIDLARQHNFTHVFLEPASMGRKHRAKMDDAALRAWYLREGFVEKSPRVLQMVFKEAA